MARTTRKPRPVCKGCAEQRQQEGASPYARCPKCLARLRERYAEAKAAGRCCQPSCTKRAVKGHTRCSWHLAALNDGTARRKAAAKRAAGRCVASGCRRKAKAGRAYCGACAKERNARKRGEGKK